MLTRIHVNQHVIKENQKTGSRKPVLTVKRGKENRYAHEVELLGPGRVIYRPDKPLSCGARCWIETDGDVRLDGEARAASPRPDTALEEMPAPAPPARATPVRAAAPAWPHGEIGPEVQLGEIWLLHALAQSLHRASAAPALVPRAEELARLAGHPSLAALLGHLQQAVMQVDRPALYQLFRWWDRAQGLLVEVTGLGKEQWLARGVQEERRRAPALAAAYERLGEARASRARPRIAAAQAEVRALEAELVAKARRQAAPRPII